MDNKIEKSSGSAAVIGLGVLAVWLLTRKPAPVPPVVPPVNDSGISITIKEVN